MNKNNTPDTSKDQALALELYLQEMSNIQNSSSSIPPQLPPRPSSNTLDLPPSYEQAIQGSFESVNVPPSPHQTHGTPSPHTASPSLLNLSTNTLLFYIYKNQFGLKNIYASDKNTCLYVLENPIFEQMNLRRWSLQGPLVYFIKSVSLSSDFQIQTPDYRYTTFLTKKGILTVKFEFMCNSIVYGWKGLHGNMTLHMYPSREIIATYKRSYVGFSKQGKLEMYSPCHQMQDLVIATAMALEEWESRSITNL